MVYDVCMTADEPSSIGVGDTPEDITYVCIIFLPKNRLPS